MKIPRMYLHMWDAFFKSKHVIGIIEATESGPEGCWWHCNKCTKKNSGDREKINLSFSTSFHKKEISAMYLNIFGVFQGAKARELFATVTFPSPTTK
jgi:hypothetical protein